MSLLKITRGLDTVKIGRKVLYYPTLASTMDTARIEARQGATEGTVIIAGEQTAGRGRLRRAWVSPSGNIALSIVLYPDIVALPYLVMVASLAVTHSIEDVAGLKAQIKWPNDVLVNGKKVCGILIENEVRGSGVEYAIVGIGINTDLNVAAYPEISNTAATLKTGRRKDHLHIKIIRALLTEFDRLYLKLTDGRDIYQDWRNRLVTLGKRVKVISGTQTIEGIAKSVDESGALVLRLADGSLKKVVAGDVTLRHNE